MGTTTLTRPRAKACCVFVALLLQVATGSRLSKTLHSPASQQPAFTFRKLLQASSTSGTSGVSYDGVWQGITYSPATVIVDDQFNLIAAACVDNELYAKFTGLSNYLDGGVILMNETFTVTDSLVEVNVTDGQAITIALSRGIGNATVLPFSVATVQPNYTVAGAEDDLVLLQTDPTGIVDWCFHWTTDTDADGNFVLAVEIEEVQIEMLPSGRPLLHAVCELGTNPPETSSYCTSTPLSYLGASSSGASSGVSPADLGLGVIYDPVAYCRGLNVDPQLADDCITLTNLAFASNVGTRNATRYCFPASGAAVTASADKDLCCAVGQILQLQDVAVDSDSVEFYCGLSSGLAPVDQSLLAPSSPSPRSSPISASTPSPTAATGAGSPIPIPIGVSSPSTATPRASPSPQAVPIGTSRPPNSPSAPSQAPSPSSSMGSARGAGGTPLGDLVASQQNAFLTTLQFGPSGFFGGIGRRRLLAGAPAPSPKGAASKTSIAAAARQLFGDNLGLEFPTSIITRTEFVCVSGPCLDLAP